MSYPKISIIIAAFNSGKTLKRTLESIRKQRYPEDKVEILVLEGGSTDKTVSIAKKFGCKILPNPKTDLIYAKQIGFLKATGRYAMFLDSDEVLENDISLQLKLSAFVNNPQVKGLMTSGYKTPEDYSPINYYVNEFGDPFSFFVYRESKGYGYLIPDWLKKYSVVRNEKDYVVLDLSKVSSLPLIELCAGGGMIDLEYMRKTFSQIQKNPGDMGQLFYFFNNKGKFLALTKNDPTIHYSSATISKYLKKIKSRIRNNVFVNDMGKGGFEGREQFHSNFLRFKKYLFVPYSFSIVFPLLDACVLAITRKKAIYFLHPLLCLYTSWFIVYYYSLKLLRVSIKMKSYGN